MRAFARSLCQVKQLVLDITSLIRLLLEDSKGLPHESVSKLGAFLRTFPRQGKLLFAELLKHPTRFKV